MKLILLCLSFFLFLNSTCSNQTTTTIKKPIKKNLKKIAELNKILFEASERGEYTKALKVIKKGADVNAIDNKYGVKVSSLYYAARYNHPKIVKLLIKNGAHLNFRANFGTTPLHIAVHQGNIEAVKELINGGADINAKTTSKMKDYPTGTTALKMAKIRNQRAIIKILLEKKAK